MPKFKKNRSEATAAFDMKFSISHVIFIKFVSLSIPFINNDIVALIFPKVNKLFQFWVLLSFVTNKDELSNYLYQIYFIYM